MTNETKTEDLPEKLDPRNRADYLKAEGYDVTIKVTYTRLRRVRALNKKQAKEFALNRETKFSERYFGSQNLRSYSVDSVRASKVEKVTEYVPRGKVAAE